MLQQTCCMYVCWEGFYTGLVVQVLPKMNQYKCFVFWEGGFLCHLENMNNETAQALVSLFSSPKTHCNDLSSKHLSKTFVYHYNPFPHIDAFWCLCSRQLFENIVTKEEIAQNVQFLLLPQCFLLLVIGYQFNYGDFLCFDKIRSNSSAAELSYEGKG